MKRTLTIVFAAIILAALVTAFLVSFNVHTSAEERGARPTAYESVQIQPRDTLWSISQKYCQDYDMTTKEYVQELKILNGLSSDNIVAGNDIVIVRFAKR